ncbi:serine/threonine-protein kinase [Actinomadura rugatobispora]|uniref:Serine/threonine-protein kinase n=1 Tax=Actinomadura rugatobispora TaxID=1994 RepID=A0ABW0ZWN3_9ACTN|nr:hypothetical protein GCM10010200_037630 [Actinomadura rugatobispora]
MEALRPGDPASIGGYECVGRLGSGGMGEVFLARAGDGALVALKLIHADLAGDAGFRARFAREAAAVRRVSGPYTAPLLDAGDVPRPWLATAYLPGLSLDQAVTRHGPLGVEATRRLGAALAEALGAIHRAGVVHRDLKPANILLTPDGPRVVDFGIAGGPEISTVDGTAGRAAGSPAYMAPEQITGAPVTPAADVFALGGVLLFCRTGSPPFGAAPLPELLGRIAHGRPELGGVGDAGLRDVVAACLAGDPARRPGTERLAALLSPSAAGTGWLPVPVTHDIAEQATPIPPPAPGRRPHPRRRAVLRVTGAAAAALAGMGAVRAFADADSPQADVLWAARATLVSGYEFGPVLGRGLLLLDRTVVTHSGGPRLDLCCLDTATGRYRWRRPLNVFGRYRGEVVAGPGGVRVRSIDELHEVDADNGTVHWSQRRRFPGLIPATAYANGLLYDIGAVAGSDDAGTLHALEPRTGREVWKRDIEGRPVSPIVVAGSVLYLISASARERRERVHALDAATGAVRWVTGFADDNVVGKPPSSPIYTDAALSVADGTVYVSVEGRHVHALDARTGATRWSVRPQVNPNVLGGANPSVAFPVAAGDVLLLGTGDGVLRAFDRRDGRQRWAVETGAPPGPVGDFRRRLTPLVSDGTVFVCGGDGVRALRAGDGRVRWERGTDPSAGEPVLAGGRLHVPGKWEVTSHDPLSGRIVQRLDLRPHGRPPTAVLPGKDALYVLAGPDAVIAVGLPG